MAAETPKVRTALGQRVIPGTAEAEDLDIQVGQPPLILQSQAYAYVPIKTPEQLKQFEEDLLNFYGIRLDASRLPVAAACETCSCCSSDDCGFYRQ